jgi:two-component system, cell cycle sensor histidine kinase and response regulator CckA
MMNICMETYNMNDENKQTEDLIKALAEARHAITELNIMAAKQKKVEEALREGEEKYLIHFSLANDVMFSYDNQFRILSVSPNVERVLGYKPEELVGGTFHDLHVLHPDYMELAFNNALKVLSGKTVYSSIYEFIAKDGARKFGEVSGVPLMRDGKVVEVITVARDITKRMEMEKSLQESEERYRITLQSMPDAVSIIRVEDAHFIYSNDAFSKITGYSLDETIGKTPFDLNLPVGSDTIDRCIELIKDNKSIDNLEDQCRKKDGTIIDALISARPVHYSGENSMIMVMADITALKQIEEEKKRLEIQSQKMDSIGTLAGGIAHDFNNLLTTIIGFTKMSMKDILGHAKGKIDLSVVRSDLGEVRNAALRARDLVNHILAFSRHTEKEYVPIDLGSTVRESLKVLRPTFPAKIKIREDLADSKMILGDPVQIHQVIMNLCTNATHAMDETGGELEVSIAKIEVGDGTANLNLDVPSGPYLRLTVRDTGHGMTNKVLVRIFDPYFTTKFNGRGTGLGLSVVHGIVKSHGGAITCKSAPGEGTTFDIYLPELALKKQRQGNIIKTASTRENKRILNLDDELYQDEGVNNTNDNQGIFIDPKNKQI